MARIHLHVIRVLFATLIVTQGPGAPSFTPRSLSAFQKTKAASLLRDRLPCLGCHELGGDGGRIGPSLSDLPRTRSAEYIYAVIRDPQGTFPGTIMPRVPLPEETIALIASYLAQREPTTPGTRLASPNSGTPVAGAAGLYGQYCAACHGVAGRGDGPNAKFLPVPPTVHADSAYMSRRPDDALFDAIFGGGFIMNRSNRMPPFGESLTRSQIWSLVRYMRTLCRCEGPAWSRDG